MATTNDIGPAPDLGDDPNVPRDILAVLNALRPIVRPRYANATARDAAITSPLAGQKCVVNGVEQTYDGTNWAPAVGAWVNLIMVGGGSALSPAPQVRFEPGGCRIKGWMSTPTLTSTAVQYASVPVGYAPAERCLYVVPGSTTTVVRVDIRTDRSIWLAASVGSPIQALLDGITYPI